MTMHTDLVRFVDWADWSTRRCDTALRDEPVVVLHDVRSHPALDAFESWCRPDEIARADRFRAAVDRDSHLAGRAIVRAVVGGWADCAPVDVEIVAVDGERPHLAAPTLGGLSFSIAHSAGRIACAFRAGGPVGVDLEPRLARRVLTPRELAALDGLGGAALVAAFLRAWTRKEALLKATGRGLRDDPAALDVVVADAEGAIVDRSPIRYGAATWACDTRLIDEVLVSVAWAV
jgi:4'-phosphopantetheinyl transferase